MTKFFCSLVDQSMALYAAVMMFRALIPRVAVGFRIFGWL
jgi:hypothetical protein